MAIKLFELGFVAADFQLATLAQNWDILKESIGEALLPAVNNYLPRLTAHLQAAIGWVTQHKEWVTFGLKVAAIGSGLLIVGGALSLMASAVLGFASAWGVIANIPGLIMALFTPMGLVLAAIALIAFGAYEIYEYWSGIKTFFVKLGSEAYDWGANMLKKFGDGIESMVMWPVHKIEEMAAKMARFLVGHSPIPEGPLHDLNIGREIARTITPAPMLTAIRRVAMVTAIAAPMMVGAGSPAMASRGAGGGVVINYSPNVTVTGGGDEAATRRAVLKALQQDRDELLKIIDGAQAKRSRREFD